MLTPQEILLKILKTKVHKKLSFIDLISSILQITYDSAYRRVINKTSLSIDEAITLAKHFNISLNTLYSVGDKNSLLVTKTPDINNANDLENYFTASYKNLVPLSKKESSSIYYSANDLPIFYFLNNTLLSKFKIYAWLNLLDTQFSLSKISFADFTPKESLLISAQNFGNSYNQFDLTEIWNDNVLNRTIKQIYHYYEIGLLKLDEALIFCDELEQLVKKIETNARAGIRLDIERKTTFTLYHNEIMALGNNVIIKTDGYKIALSPYSLLSYYIITHPETCEALEDSFKKQLESSSLLSSSEEKGRSLFFNKLYKIINLLRARIKIDDQFPLI